MLSYGLLNGFFGLIYVFIYVLLREVTSWCNHLVLCFRRKMTLSWHYYFLFILFQLPFGSDLISLFNPFMVHGKAASVNNTSAILFGIYVNRNNCIAKAIFIICLLLHMRNEHITQTLTTLCFHSCLWTLIFLKIFHSIPIFNGFILLVRIYAITYLNLIACMINVYPFLVFNLLDATYECYVG